MVTIVFLSDGELKYRTYGNLSDKQIKKLLFEDRVVPDCENCLVIKGGKVEEAISFAYR